MTKLIIPGADRRQDIRSLVDRHNRAMSHMHPEQHQAINRLVTASLLVVQMVGNNAPPEIQQAAAQEALAEVIRREANGEPVMVTMWRKPLAITPDGIDQLAKTTEAGSA